MRQLHRTASSIAGIYTLVQAILYTVFAIYGCAIFSCLAKYPLTIDGEHKSNYLLYLTYFKGKCDAHPAGNFGPKFVGESNSAERTYYFLIAYGIASAIWIPTSTLLVVASVSRVKGSTGALLYYPWICNSVVLLIMDVVGGVWYGIDISKTLTASDFKTFVGINVGPLPHNTDGITVVPSVIMTAIFLRGIILLILNAIFLGVVIQACREVKKSFSTSEFIRGSTSKTIQRQMEKNEELHKHEDPEVRWVKVTEEVMLPRLEVPTPERVNYVPESSEPGRADKSEPRQIYDLEYPISPQSPIGDAPSPVIKRRSSLHRMGSSPVFDVKGNPTGETFPFPQDPNLRYNLNDPPSRFQYVERCREEREREMNRERQIEWETDRELARMRELDRERQDREFQRLKGAAEEDKLNNQRPWSYVNPSDLKLTPRYDQTVRPRFAPPEVSPKPSIPAPDYSGKPGGERATQWDPTNLSRSNSGVGDRYNDHRWNPRRAY